MDRSSELGYFEELTSHVAPDEIDLALPMLRAHLGGDSIGRPKTAAVAAFGGTETLVLPALISALSTLTVFAIPILKTMVGIGAPTLGAAVDFSTLRDVVRGSRDDHQQEPFDRQGVVRMLDTMEAELREVGLDPEVSTGVAFRCMKALIDEPQRGATLLETMRTS